MSSTAYTKLKVGTTIIFALVILIGGFLWVKNYNPLIKKVTVNVLFDDGRGITGGEPVLMSGVKIGEVRNISLSSDHRALVSFYIDYFRLSEDTKFVIEDVGLMGDKALVIIPGSEKAEIDLKKVQKGSEYYGFSAIIDKANEGLSLINKIIADVDTNLDIKALSSELQNTMAGLRETSEEIKSLAGDVRKPLMGSVSNIEILSSDMKDFMGRNESRIENTITGFQESTAKISDFMERLNNLNALIDTIAVYVNEDEGTLSKLLRNGELYEELRKTNAEIDAFVKDFRKNPGKYTKDMNFKIRLF